MLAPFATLVFLASLWLVAKVAFEFYATSGGRIAAALLGKSCDSSPPALQLPARFSRQRMAIRPLRAAPARMRAAA